MARTGKWIAGLVALAVAGGGIAMAIPLLGGGARDCEAILDRTIAAVEGVLDVHVECSNQFGGGWQRQQVRLNAATPSDAYPIVEQVLRALAAEASADGSWSTPQVYRLTDDSTLSSLAELGFNGSPSIAVVREHYGIVPR
jgi:hypothetical protein